MSAGGGEGWLTLCCNKNIYFFLYINRNIQIETLKYTFYCKIMIDDWLMFESILVYIQKQFLVVRPLKKNTYFFVCLPLVW